MRIEDIDTIASDSACENPLRMHGDPDYYGAAVGLYCVPSARLGVVLRFYDQPGATFSMIGDWADLIDADNQIIYTDYWFATGPKEVLLELFDGFGGHGPQASAPDGLPKSPKQAERSLCSSIAYGVILQVVIDPRDVNLEQYFSSYPGLSTLAKEIAAEAVNSGITREIDDDLATTAHLTEWDDRIKGFCR